MSADTSNYSHIQDEDVLRKMWQDTDDFGKKKEIRSHMYKLREQRLREFYNGSEISESKKTTTSGKVTQSSTHTDSLVDQSFQSFKSKEVRDSESPTREIHYKAPDKMASKEWQVESSNEASLDGKTKIHSSIAAVQGTQKIEGGQIDFRAKSENMSSEFRDANEHSSTTRSQSTTSSRMVTSSSTQPEQIELPSNLHGITKVIRETKTLPDGSRVTTTRYDTSGGTSQFTSQSSTSSRHTNENIISNGNQIVELPERIQEVTKVIKETKTLPYGSTVSSTTYDTVSGVAKNNLKTTHTTSSNRVINEKEYIVDTSTQKEPNNLQSVTKITKTLPDGSRITTTKYDSVNDNNNATLDDAKTRHTSSSSQITSTKVSNISNPDFPNNLQGVTKVTKETKTLPDGSIMTITKYDTASGTTTHSEIVGNVKISEDHSSVTNKSFKHTDEAKTTDNRQSYKKQDYNRQVINEDRHFDTADNNQYCNTDNKITVVSTTEKNNKDYRHLKDTVSVTKQTIEETDGNKISPTKISPQKQPANVENHVENITITKQYNSDNINTNSFINKERQQEDVTRDKNIREVISPKVDDSRKQEPRVKESPKTDYQPSKPTTGQYDTTYKTDYTSRKISVDISPTHDAFARSLRSVSPDRVPSRGSHRTSNSSIPEKMRHPSRISPERQPKDRSISPTKSVSSTDTYICNKKSGDNESHRKISSTTDTFNKTVSQETITVTRSKQNRTNKSTDKDIVTTSHEVVTDLDEDLIKTTEKPRSTPGSRPTSLELTRKPKKITDRSPSSPLTDTKRSPTKEIRRSSSFRSPTKEASSPTKGSYPKSPTKETPSNKNLPEDRPLKRTDTYEERCRQILGITEVTEKRKNSLERSGSKRNSLRRNISSHLVDTTETVTSPTKSPTKERPVSPTKSKSPIKERPVSPTKSQRPLKEKLESPTKERSVSPTKGKSPLKERPVSPTKSTSPIKETPVSPTKSQSPLKEKLESPTKERSASPTKGKSPLKERPVSPTKSRSPIKESPTKQNHGNIDDVEITTTITRETIYNREDQNISDREISSNNRPWSPTKGNKTNPIEDQPLSTVTTIKKETTICTTNRDETVITDENEESIKPIDELTPRRKPISEHPVESTSPEKNTDQKVVENIIITSEYDKEIIDNTSTSRYKSTKEIVSEKLPHQTPKSPIKNRPELVETNNTDKIVLEDIINIEESILTDDSIDISKRKTSKVTPTDEKPKRKGPYPNEEFSSQPKTPSKQGPKGPTNKFNTTTKLISQEKLITDIHSSTEVIVDEDDINISETEFAKVPVSKNIPKTAPQIKPSSDLPKSQTKKVTKKVSEETTITVDMDTNRNKTTDKSPKRTLPSEKENVKSLTEYTSEVEDREVITKKSTIVVDTDDEIQPASKFPSKISNQPKEETIGFIRNEKIQREIEDENTCHEKPSTTDTNPNEVVPKKLPVPTKPSPQSKQVNNIDISVENTTKVIKTDNDEETIIDEFVVTDDSDTPKIIMGTPIPKDTKPIKKGKETVTTNSITKEDDTVVVTDEFEIVSNPNEQPSNKKPSKKGPGITEYPPQNKKPISKKISQEKITPKSKPVTQKSEFPSQTKKDKRPLSKEPIATEKFFEPISYENQIPVEEPLVIKKHINPHCREDEVKKTETSKTVTSKKIEKPTQKAIPVNKQKVPTVKKIERQPDKNVENSIQRKPINGISEYKDQYSKPKPTQKAPSNKIKNTTEETTKTIHKLSDKISSIPSRSTTKPLVNGIQKPKETPKSSKPSTVTVNSVKVTKVSPTDTVTRRTNKIVASKENVSPIQKSRKEPADIIVKMSPVTKVKPSQPEQLTTKKHVVTTTITLNGNRQPITTKPKLTTKVTKSERNRVTDLKQKHINEYVSTDTDEDEIIRETVDVTRRTITKKPEKKCITTKTVIINNNGEQRQVIVDLQRSKSSREPTPDRICPVPTSNGEYHFPRYPDEIVEPDDDDIRIKPKRLSDIPLIESENVNNFSRITEVTDTKVVTDVDRVEETDESLLSVNKKINLFLDNVDRVKQVKNKPSGPAPKVERPKLDISEGLESDECLLSVSEKVNKFVNAADQFMNVRDVPERPKSPRCKNYDEKNSSEIFITTEQNVLEKQCTNVDTRKISLNSLDKIDNKIPKDTKPFSENRIPSPTKFKPTLDTVDKPEQKYPNYNTITKKVSLENLEIKSSLKTSEDVPKRSPENPQSSYTTTTTETRETRIGSRDFSPDESRYKPGNRLSPDRRSPDRKSSVLDNKPETPVKRPSNEYGSIKNIKTEEKISTNRDHSPVENATPKTSKTKVVDDKKTFLSSTSRLRSTESIKKARAIFENISKDQEPAKTPLKNKTVSKKLNYTEDIRKKETHPGTGGTPHYMLPLDRNTDRPESKATDRDSPTPSSPDVYNPNSDIPHYMLPLHRKEDHEYTTHESRTVKTKSDIRDHKHSTWSPVRDTSRPKSPDSRSESSDVPHYMLPLDRSVHTHSHPTTRDSRPRSKSPEEDRPRNRTPEVHSKTGDVPHYMLPLNHNVHTHSHESSIITRESRTNVQATERDRSPDVRSETDNIPHYRLPLERNVYTTTSEIKDNRSRSKSPERDSPITRNKNVDVPHYMLPLDHHVTTTTTRVTRPKTRSPERDNLRSRSPEVRSENGNVPHYTLPLDRSVHTHDHTTTTTIRESRSKGRSPERYSSRSKSPEIRSETGDSPHYRLPLDRSIHTHTYSTTTAVRESTAKTRSPERHSPRSRSPEDRSEAGDVPHYMLPLERNVHPDRLVTTSITRESRHRTKSPQRDSSRNRSPEDRSETGDVPHYMLPLDRNVHSDRFVTTSPVRDTRYGTKSPERDSPRSRSPEIRSETGDVPHYMLPLDRNVQPDRLVDTTRDNRPRTKSPERESSRTRSPEGKLGTGDIPHYRLPLDRSVHIHATTRDSRPRTNSPEINNPSENHSEAGDSPHYRLPLDRSVHTHTYSTTTANRESRARTRSPERHSPRSRSPEDRSDTGDVPHYMLPLDRNVQPDRLVDTRDNRPRTKSPERESSRTRSPEGKFGNGDIPHYRLPLDRSVHIHATTRDSRPRTNSPEINNPSENHSEAGDSPHYRLPLDRSVHTHTYSTTTASRESRARTKSPERHSPRSRSPEDRSETGDVPHYMLPLDRNVHPDRIVTSSTRDSRHGIKSPERDSPRNRSPDGRSETSDVPHYMLPLDKNARPHNTPASNVETRTTKFGITLRKVHSGSPVSIPSKPSPHKPPTETKFVNIESITEEDIEDIFELEILEELLQKIERYELRRIIRTQIRLVKKLISENRLTIYIKERRQLKSKQETITRKSSYTRKYSDQNIETKRPTSQNTSPQRTIKKTYPEETKHTSPTRVITEKPEDKRRSSLERTEGSEIITTTTTTTTRYSPTRQQSPPRRSSPNYPTSSKSEEIIRKSSPERITKTKVTETTTKTEQTRKLSTEKTSITSVSSTERKNIPQASDKNSPKPDTKTGYSILKKTEIRQNKTEDDKPEWVKQRNLKKVTSTNTNEKITTNARRAVKEENRITTVGCEPTDLITSSYGVGPTDENGTPLFGLKALRAQSNGTTKVQGTFVKSEYYSENGNAPVGQISFTKYSTDPRDLSTEEQIQNNDLITSVTTTQQFGYENTPSLETLTSTTKGKQIEDSVTETSQTSNFKRKNSVKALSQKFIDTAVESLKNERQTSYPKAGLILRTSSFKESKSASSEDDIPTDVITATKTSKQTTTTTTTTGGTFLSNKSTISGVQDVITRMKTEEYQEGDSSEDIEAKSLLNKFIGSQVILSGMENRSTSIKTSKTSTSDIVPTTTNARKTIKITTTATEGGKTKTKTLVFQSPITEEELENIWDEQTLRLLLEQSTQYEERRVIRNRLRTVMAEQEACAELVEKASQDQTEGKIEENVSVGKSTTKSPTASTTTVTKITTQQQITKKPLSPFAKFRQLDKQNSLNTPPSTPGTPKSPGNGPLFKFTDPAVSLSAATIKDRLLFWCRMKTKEYENVQLDNFSTSWADGLAFCALIHHFLPDAFDYHALTAKDRRHNFELAFRVASEKADIFPLLDVDDMMATRRPDWKCVFTYVQSVYRRFKDEEI